MLLGELFVLNFDLILIVKVIIFDNLLKFTGQIFKKLNLINCRFHFDVFNLALLFLNSTPLILLTFYQSIFNFTQLD